MISHQTRSKEWIMGIRGMFPGRDPILIEKMIMALTLVENLRLSGLDFIFKGGTSLILLLGTPQRFSIDVDIVLPDEKTLDKSLQIVLNQGAFHRIEENWREGSLPKKHFKFFYHSSVQGKENYILLDILFQDNPYSQLQEIPILSPLVSIEGEPTKIICPSVECLLGDKLTAFAPHTTGIQYGRNKELEMVKQLFDIALLFDSIEDMNPVTVTFKKIAASELMYRGMDGLTPQDVLMDAFNTAVLIGTRGTSSGDEYTEILYGIKKMPAYILSGFFSLDSAILCASKAAYLSALIIKRSAGITRYDSAQGIFSWNVANPAFSKLNKLRKTSPEAFHYFYQALALLESGKI